MMPVEINLLPKKKKKDRTIISFISLISVLSLLSVLLITFYAQQVESETEELVTEYEELRLKSAELQGQIQRMDDSDEAKLNSMIKKLEDKIIPASSILHEVVSLMPDEGYMITYDYLYPFELVIEMGFLEVRDVSYYYHELINSPIVSDVKVESMFGEEMGEEEDDIFTEEYLPHYKTHLVITLNPEAVRAHGKESEEDEEQ
ncbi:hypothetical protein LGQ02_14730 [Bacillus shivajii]|uniref:hypothetical protein n=1 Tax=Bacillus shivajii TaxID=1983719 RepID=UPI001CFAB9DD|nr:hypothetical protein [Bacillus shivajii]UCZ52094.1 hypothetical protein LGQ02_14730 [Bacillus shivajii]